MKNFLSILTSGLFAAMLCACGNESVTRDAEQDETYPIVITTNAFKFILHDGVTRAQAGEIGDSLLANRDRIQNHLRVTVMPQVTISLWSRDHSGDFYAEMKNRIGQMYPGATGYTPSGTEMCVLWDPSMVRGSVHEFSHLVSIALKPNIGNNPRWLWEAIAQYESRTYDPPSTWSAADRTFPGFVQLNQYNSSLPYRWGYFVISFVLQRWGDDAYINLIRSNGNTTSALGISEEELGRLVGVYVKTLAESRSPIR
jgi:hypothetical protein